MVVAPARSPFVPSPPEVFDRTESDSRYATAAQGTKADTAVQPSSTDILTKKTIDADNNTITNLALGAEVTGASTDLIDTAAIAYLADLGDAASKDVGTTAGTVAAGDDSRIVGAVQTAATDISNAGWVINEDDMASNSAVKVPTQQSVKAYVGSLFSSLGASLALAANYAAAWVLLNVTGTLPSRALLQAVSASSGMSAYLSEAGREGLFRWSSNNLSGFVANDPQQAVYVPPSSDTTGASGSWVRQREQMIVDPFWCGAAGDGSTDDHAALQAAADLAIAIGSSLYLRGGTVFYTASAVTVAGRIRVFGDGYRGDEGAIYQTSTTVSNSNCSAVKCSSANSAFTVATNASVQFDNFQIWYPAGVSSSVPAISGASAGGATDSNTYSVFKNLFISGAGAGIDLLDFYDYTIDGCNIANHTGYGIKIKSLSYPNYGDGIIANNKIMSGSATAHIYIQSGGGTRIVNNKCNYGNNVNTIAVWVNLFDYQVAAVHTTFYIEPLIIADNSFEGQVQGIVVTRQTGSKGEIGQMVVSGNQVWAGGSALNIVGDASGDKYVNGFTVGSNYFSANANSSAVVSLDHVQNGSVCANTMSGGQATSATGLVLTNFTSVKHSGNSYTSNAPFSVSTPAVPASAVSKTNDYGCAIAIDFAGTSVTAIDVNGTNILTQVAGNAGRSLVLNPGDTIKITYSGGSNSWLWRAFNP